MTIADTIRVQGADGEGAIGVITLVDVTFTEGEPSTYAIPLAGRKTVTTSVRSFVGGDGSRRPTACGSLLDGLRDTALAGALLEMIERRRVARGQRRRLVGTRAEGFVAAPRQGIRSSRSSAGAIRATRR